MKQSIIILFLVSLFFQSEAQTQSLAERLGYPAGTKLLIIHADDLGVSHSENMASIRAMEKGVVNSASIMVPCPWFPEIAAYAKTHPSTCFGLHLTLTSEWKLYKWGPVTSHDQVPSLLTPQGYLNETDSAFMHNAKAAEVEKELRCQIERAKQFGVDPTHFDAHMFAAGSTPEFVQILLKLGREYKVPVHVSKDFIQTIFKYDVSKYQTPTDIVVDKTIMILSHEYKTGTEQYYINHLKSLANGLNVILLHAAYDNDEMQAVTAGYDSFHAPWRQKDFDFFTSEKCKKILAEEKIKLVTWKEIRDKILRK